MIAIKVDYSREINFAMQQNHIPVVRRVYVSNVTGTPVSDVKVHIRFDPAFAEECVLHVSGVAPGCEEVVDNVPIHFSATYLSRLTERIQGDMKVSVYVGDELDYETSYEISLLAFNELQASGIYPEISSAFVTPNHPAITPIIKRASEILGSWTGSSAMDEYQTRDPNRVKMQMAAVFEAIRELDIAYCTIPASFEKDGQRVRLVGEIMNTRIATCLDMSLLYCSCLEAVGINPLLIFTAGHAFAGGWLVQSTFPDTVNDDPSLLTKRMAGGINEILLVETTMAQDGRRAAFDEAAAYAEGELVDVSDFNMFIDIARGRAEHIRPLPLLEDGTIDLSPDKDLPTSHVAPSSLIATDKIDTYQDGSVSKQVIWERKLLDLSLRNSLLNTRITKDTIQIMSVSLNEVEDALADGSSFSFAGKPTGFTAEGLQAGVFRSINEADPVYQIVKSDLADKRLRTYHTPEALVKSLTHLYRTSRTSMEENGANTLYLALGMLKWYETRTSTVPRYAPILLLPVEIIRHSATSGYVIRSRDEEAVLNITLLEMLRQFYGLQIAGLDPLPTDDSGVDVSLIFNTIRRYIMGQKGWDVEEQAILGLFSFNKFLMWHDIHNNVDILRQNKIVKSLLDGVIDKDVNVEIGESANLDSKYAPGSIVLPISADSSQLEAITAAASGKSFILHGPPGTGKSQTITNIIANALYNGKKVLFVAEKMAALEVVQKRLEQIGLAPFCLEMHSNKAKKTAVIEQLKRTTEVAKVQSPAEYLEDAARIGALRGELNDYIDALHKVYPSGMSLYDCIARYSSFGEEVPAMELPADVVAGIRKEDMPAIMDALTELETACSIAGNPCGHPLAEIKVQNYPNTDVSSLISTASVQSLSAGISSAAGIFGMEDAASLPMSRIHAMVNAAKTLLSAKVLPPEMLQKASADDIDAADAAVLNLKGRAAAMGKLSARYKESIAGCDADAIEQMYESAMTRSFIARFLAIGKVRKALAMYTRDGSKPSADCLESDVADIVSLCRENKEIKRRSALMEELFGRLWDGENTDPGMAESAVNDVRELLHNLRGMSGSQDAFRNARTHLAGKLAVAGIREFKEYNSSVLERLVGCYENYVSQASRIESVLDASLCQPDQPGAMGSVSAILENWRGSLGRLRDWTVYNRQKAAVAGLGLRAVVDEIESGRIPCNQIKDSFIKGFCLKHADQIVAGDMRLNDFHGMFFGGKIQRFRELCAEFENLTRQEIYARLASALPALQKEASQTSSVGILQRNIRNNCRGTSLRQLIDKIQDILPRMCPCMLMSPLSVAQYIDAKGFKFDLVIFDEASQMPTCEAVGAIARGHQIIVVGDPNQMPPTSFFATNVYDEDNPDKEDLESILDDCLALSLPSKYLLWHYRSKHESLIAFSNCKYYENKLMTFPSPDDITTRLQYQHVADGIYDRGGTRQNKAEAEAVIQEVKRRLEDTSGPRRSIGIITFNTNQQGFIEDRLNDLFRDRPDLEEAAGKLPEPIFIKNLENVQGDERDVILFSVGYGPDSGGTVSLNFGPLNRDGGWRRLNVAVSRARYEMKVFSTLTSDQINMNRTSAEGVAGLKAFLEYAERGRDALHYNTASSARTTDGLVLSIADALRAKGYVVETNVGCSGYRVDIGVVSKNNPDTYSLAIVCDGYNSRSARTARDREIVQQRVLHLLGWRIHRVWALDWWHDRDRTLQDIICAIESDGDSSSDDDSFPENPVKTFVAPPPVPVDDTPDPRIQPYEEENSCVGSVSADEFSYGYYDSAIRKKVEAVLSKEAPVSFAILTRRICAAFGFSQCGPRMKKHLQDLYASMSLKSTGEGDSLFFWHASQNPAEYNVFRPVSSRDSTDIAPEEIAVAVAMILEDQGSLPMDALTREIAGVFNFSRLGTRVLPSMQAGIAYALKSGKAVEVDGKISAGYFM